MKVSTELKNIRISPRKIRLVVPVVLGQKVTVALIKLRFTNKSSARPLSQALKTASADAAHNHKLDPEKLIVQEIIVSDGPTLKRGRPVARGSLHSIFKRTSHIKVTLEGKDGS
jgi:large subunit ribosomal protein L22